MRVRFAVSAWLLVPAAAWGAVNFELGNGDKVTGTIAAPGETEVFRFSLPKGAVVAVKGRPGKGGPELAARLLDPDGAEVSSAEGARLALSEIAAPRSGVYTLELSARDEASTGAFSLSVAWKSPSKFGATVTLDADATASLPFAADAGASAKLSVKPSKGSPAAADLVALRRPDLTEVAVGGTSAGSALPAAGDYLVRYRNAGAAMGEVACTVTVKAPKPAKRRIALTPTLVGDEPQFSFASLVGAAGGAVALPDFGAGDAGAAIAGSSVTIPAGALGSATSIVIGTASAVSVAPAAAAGPSVFFGPEGLQFDRLDAAKRAVVTIPYDAAFAGPLDSLVVYTRDAKGNVTLVPPPYTVDAVNHTVSVATSHFSSFVAAAPGGSIGTGPGMTTEASSLAALDLCLAHEPTAQPPQFAFFAAGGSSKTVLGLKPKSSGPGFDVVPFAGGGASSADGTPRLQFQFPSPVTSVFAHDDGRVLVATPNQIYLVDLNGDVSLFAGTAAPGDSGDEGFATSASFTGISCVIADLFGRVYVADGGAHRIRTIDPPSFRVHAFAGSGTQGFGQDGESPSVTTFFGPARIAFTQAGGLLVADGGRLRRINSDGTNVTVAGSKTGSTGSTGDGGPPAAALFQQIVGVTTFFDFQADRELVAVTDALDHTVRLLDVTGGTVTLLAGQHGQQGDAPDASPPTGLLNLPTAVLLGPSDAVFLDQENQKVRRVTR